MLRSIIITSLLLNGWISHGQLKHVRFESLDSLQRQAPRTIVVFLHTDWCKYCHTMKNTTFKDQKVELLLNDHFYFVSFDGESEEDVEFLGRTFKYKSTGKNTGVHELAEQLGTKNGTLNYPTLTFLNHCLLYTSPSPRDS